MTLLDQKHPNTKEVHEETLIDQSSKSIPPIVYGVIDEDLLLNERRFWTFSNGRRRIEAHSIFKGLWCRNYLSTKAFS